MYVMLLNKCSKWIFKNPQRLKHVTRKWEKPKGNSVEHRKERIKRKEKKERKKGGKKSKAQGLSRVDFCSFTSLRWVNWPYE